MWIINLWVPRPASKSLFYLWWEWNHTRASLKSWVCAPESETCCVLIPAQPWASGILEENEASVDWSKARGCVGRDCVLSVKGEAGFPDGRGETVGVSACRYSLLSLMDSWGKSMEARGQDELKVSGLLGDQRGLRETADVLERQVRDTPQLLSTSCEQPPRYSSDQNWVPRSSSCKKSRQTAGFFKGGWSASLKLICLPGSRVEKGLETVFRVALTPLETGVRWGVDTLQGADHGMWWGSEETAGMRLGVLGASTRIGNSIGTAAD